MPRGDNSSYTDRQKRQAEHIEEGYEKRGSGSRAKEKSAGSKATNVKAGRKGGKATKGVTRAR